jgi:prolyl-tRNA synthetase
VVTPVNMADAAQKNAAEEIYRACLGLGLDALFDDRDERPGVKFKDADLIGVPFRITVGKKVPGEWWSWWSGGRRRPWTRRWGSGGASGGAGEGPWQPTGRLTGD